MAAKGRHSHSPTQCSRADKPLELTYCRLTVALSQAPKKAWPLWAGWRRNGWVARSVAVCSTGLFLKALVSGELNFISPSE